MDVVYTDTQEPTDVLCNPGISKNKNQRLVLFTELNYFVSGMAVLFLF